MFRTPEYSRDVSICLSEILDDLGVNESIVLKRRRACLLQESLLETSSNIKDLNVPTHMFGSRIEGTTTLGLDSDIDVVVYANKFNVIQNWEDWEHGLYNFLMIKDDNTCPGYCMLQRLRDDAPIPFEFNYLSEKEFVSDRRGRIFMRNTTVDFSHILGTVRHGPANSRLIEPSVETDIVPALPCKTWPINARRWLDRQGFSMWPTKEMKKYCSTTGCFVVGVGHTGSDHEVMEWRISTSHAERCLMFSLNITQLRCYVIMKMIVKTYITPYFIISSFMCKTLLFHCIENTSSSIWREDNLLACFIFYVHMLYKSVENEYCPHFIIHENNLMKGKISREIKPYVLEMLRHIVITNGKALLGITCDDLGKKIQSKIRSLSGWNEGSEVRITDSELEPGWLLFNTGIFISDFFSTCLYNMTFCRSEIVFQILKRFILRNIHIYNNSHGFEKQACRLLTPVLCSGLGSVLASLNIQECNSISQQALALASLGLNSDVSSGKLKLASMLYCVGDFGGTELILRDTEDNYDLNVVEPCCTCYAYGLILKIGFHSIATTQHEEAIPRILAYCVKFMPCEMNCIPKELRHEMFRSRREELATRGPRDHWMDWAVVDSLPFLYFLQYKTFCHLRRLGDKQRALSNLLRTIDNHPNLKHRETALNLLGKCMEQEDRTRDAFNCYLRSLNLRPRNNAARFHICRLLSSVINQN